MAARRAQGTGRSRAEHAVSVDLGALEPIRRGSGIVIDSGETMDERALAAGLRFDRGRALPEVTSRGRRVTITIDDSFPLGPNILYLSDLYSPDGERIKADLEVPFFVIDTKASLPTDVRLESYSRVVVDGDSIRRASLRDKAVYELFKGVRRTTGKRWEGVYDRTGKAVDFDDVRGKVMKARVGKYGKLQPRLHARLGERGSGRLSVAIWLRADLGGRQKKAERGEIKKPARRETDARRRFAELARSFAEQHKLYDLDKDLRVDNAAPVILAELDRREIRRLAASDEVSAIFLYEREGFDDLANSIAIAQSDDTHDLGYTGSGVNVAVYERGPDDTTNLQIAARFRTDPDTSQHSRHTHGIIKNRESGQPHGHAPDCRLHSANDYDLDAIRWAAHDRGCTVISQSFHRDEEQTSDDLSFDDIYKDWLALNWPYPTICEAAGNGLDTEYVNHKGFNRLAVANHDDAATGMAGNTVFLNPSSDHGDRELPEIAANGMDVTTVGVTDSGTSMAAPAVAGSTACVQEVNGTLKSWPEGCRAIQLAAAKLNPNGSTWWREVNSGIDAQDGSGSLNTLNAVRIAEQRKGRNNAPAPRGWDVGTLRSSDIGGGDETTFSYRISVPGRIFYARTMVKVALAWDSDVNELSIFGLTIPISSVLTVDLDLRIYNSAGALVGYSGSWDNSYEIAEFRATPGETYTIKIRRWSGTDDVWYGIAWNTTSTPLIAVGDLVGIRAVAARR